MVISCVVLIVAALLIVLAGLFAVTSESFPQLADTDDDEHQYRRPEALTDGR
jgi:hypothetical protein